jgi:hypothetical protein
MENLVFSCLPALQRLESAGAAAVAVFGPPGPTRLAADVLAVAGRRDMTRFAKYRAYIREISRLPLRPTVPEPAVGPTLRDDFRVAGCRGAVDRLANCASRPLGRSPMTEDRRPRRDRFGGDSE